MKDKIIVGYDLGEAYAQISYCSYENQVPETLSASAEEKYSIPLVMCKRYGVNQWFYGYEAYKHAENEEGILVGDILKAALANEKIDIEENSYDAVSLLTLFVKRSLSGLYGATDTDRLEGIMFTCENLDAEMVRVLNDVVEGLALKCKFICFQSHAESFYQYMLHQAGDLWVRDVLLCDYTSDQMKLYHLSMNRNTTPIVAFVDKSEHHFFTPNAYPGVQDKMDARFLRILQENCEEQLFSSIYLIGEGFDEEWMQDSLQYLCKGRRVFQGNNLYSKGACYGMLERIIPSQIGKKHLLLGEDKLKANIGMQVYRNGQKNYLALLDAGIGWHEASKDFEFYLTEGNQFELVITPLNGRDVRYADVTLEGLPKRETPTRLYLEISMAEENKIKLYVEDLGFGEIAPSGYQKWTEYFTV